MSRDPRIDAYIETRARPFAQPILRKIRERMHAAGPAIEEAMKWSSPTFMYKGKMLAGMAAFKEHATFGFWYGDLVTGAGTKGGRDDAMGQFGRMTSVADLPGDAEFDALIRKAAQVIDSGAKPPHMEGRGKHPKAAPETPAELAAALAANPAARKHYEAFAPGQRREYDDWIAGAKQDATREKRLAQAIEWIAEGKKRHWKYEKC